jgi:hypothetical protein
MYQPRSEVRWPFPDALSLVSSMLEVNKNAVYISHPRVDSGNLSSSVLVVEVIELSGVVGV